MIQVSYTCPVLSHQYCLDVCFPAKSFFASLYALLCVNDNRRITKLTVVHFVYYYYYYFSFGSDSMKIYPLVIYFS